MLPRILLRFLAAFALLAASLAHAESSSPDIRTPPPPPTPRINGAAILGGRPGSPFLYTIPATGERPLQYAVDGLPAGLVLDAAHGRITGRLATPGEHVVTFRATNRHGTAERKFRIVVGERIGLTPPLGWNSWNCWGSSVDQEKVLKSARAFVAAGLINHGWTYINIDDGWQGARGGAHHGIQPNAKFPDMKQLVDEIHALGLKAGIYSTPWITTYANYIGGSSDDPEGAWERAGNPAASQRHGKYGFEQQDAAQFAEWGFDYLKYDWKPNDVPHTRAMAEALRASGRDVFFSLSNAAPFKDIAGLAPWANAWRTTNDIVDTWQPPTPRDWEVTVTEIGFNQDKWAPLAGPGHWNDPDMLVVGWVGWGPRLHPTKLTPAEQYSHVSLWSLLAAPLLLGCDLERLDAFTLNLLTNDEVIAINQDPLGEQARRVATLGPIDIYARPMEDGSIAVGAFNRGDVTHTVSLYVPGFGPKPPLVVRDVWRQRDVATIATEGKPGLLTITVPAHDAMLYRVRPGSENTP